MYPTERTNLLKRIESWLPDAPQPATAMECAIGLWNFRKAQTNPHQRVMPSEALNEQYVKLLDDALWLLSRFDALLTKGAARMQGEAASHLYAKVARTPEQAHLLTRKHPLNDPSIDYEAAARAYLDAVHSTYLKRVRKAALSQRVEVPSAAAANLLWHRFSLQFYKVLPTIEDTDLGDMYMSHSDITRDLQRYAIISALEAKEPAKVKGRQVNAALNSIDLHLLAEIYHHHFVELATTELVYEDYAAELDKFCQALARLHSDIPFAARPLAQDVYAELGKNSKKTLNPRDLFGFADSYLEVNRDKVSAPLRQALVLAAERLHQTAFLTEKAIEHAALGEPTLRKLQAYADKHRLRKTVNPFFLFTHEMSNLSHARSRPTPDEVVQYHIDQYRRSHPGKTQAIDKFIGWRNRRPEYMEEVVTLYTPAYDRIKKLRDTLFDKPDGFKAQWIKQLATDHEEELLTAGFSSELIRMMATQGSVPSRKFGASHDYSIDHVTDRAFNGTNLADNFFLVARDVNELKNKFLSFQIGAGHEPDATFWIVTWHPKADNNQRPKIVVPNQDFLPKTDELAPDDTSGSHAGSSGHGTASKLVDWFSKFLPR